MLIWKGEFGQRFSNTFAFADLRPFEAKVQHPEILWMDSSITQHAKPSGNYRNHLPCKRLVDLPVSSWFLNMDLLTVSSDRQFGIYNLYFAGLHRCNWEISFLGMWCSAGIDYELLNEFRIKEIDPFTWSLFPVKNDNLKFVTTSRPTTPSSASRRLFISVVYRITFLALATSNSPGIIYAMHEIRNKLPSLPSDAQFTRHTWARTCMWSRRTYRLRKDELAMCQNDIRKNKNKYRRVDD